MFQREDEVLAIFSHQCLRQGELKNFNLQYFNVRMKSFVYQLGKHQGTQNIWQIRRCGILFQICWLGAICAAYLLAQEKLHLLISYEQLTIRATVIVQQPHQVLHLLYGSFFIMFMIASVFIYTLSSFTLSNISSGRIQERIVPIFLLLKKES